MHVLAADHSWSSIVRSFSATELSRSLLLVSGTIFHVTSRLCRPNEFSAVVWTLIFSTVPFQTFSTACDTLIGFVTYLVTGYTELKIAL